MGQRVNHNVEWVTDDDNNVVGYQRAHQDIVCLPHLDADGGITLSGAVKGEAAGTTLAEVGAKNGGTVTVVEKGDGNIHKSIFTLTATPVTLTDDAGNGAYAALKLYDFLAGNIVTLGAVIDADLTLTEAWWTDAAEGDVGLGTVAAAVGTTLTGTTQNIIATTAIAAMTAQAGVIDAQSSGAGTSGAAGGTDADLVLNIRIDDSANHFPNVVTNGTFTGNADGWTPGAGWAYGTNKVDATLADTALEQTIALLPGVSYSLVFTTTRSAGSVRASVGGTLGTARSSAATFTETIVAGSDGKLKFSEQGSPGR